MNTSTTHEWRPKLPTIWRPYDCEDIVWFKPALVSIEPSDSCIRSEPEHSTKERV